MALEARWRGDIRVIHLLAQRAPFLGQRIERGKRRGGRGRLAQPRVQLAPLRIDAGRQPASFLARLAAPFRCRLDSPRCACTRRTACSNVATGRAPAASRRFCAAVSHDALTYSSNGTANRIRLNPPSSRNFRCSDNMPSRRFIFVLPIVWPGFPPCLACRDRQNSFNPLTAEGLQTIELLHGRFALSQTGAEFSAPRGARRRA